METGAWACSACSANDISSRVCVRVDGKTPHSFVKIEYFGMVPHHVTRLVRLRVPF